MPTWTGCWRFPRAGSERHCAALLSTLVSAHLPNCRGRKFPGVQRMLNRLMGVPMVLRGAHEMVPIDAGGQVDVFFPDGRRSLVLKDSFGIEQFRA